MAIGNHETGTPMLRLMRGGEGLAIARALVALLLVQIFAGGLHTGVTAASAADVAVLCATIHGSAPGGEPVPARSDVDPCCVIGCATAPVGHAEPAAAPITLPQTPDRAITRAPETPPRSPLRISLAHGPRGPPLSA